MKKTALISFLLVIVTILSYGQVLDLAVTAFPTSGLTSANVVVSTDSSEIGVNYYLRDDADNSIIEGPVAGDGNGINFTADLISATKTYNVYGIKPSTGLYFDGTDDYVGITSHSDFEFGIGDFAIEVWIKTDITLAAGVEQAIISNTIFHVGGIVETEFWLGRIGNKVVFNIYGTDSQTFSDTEINDDKWHHIVGVRTDGKVELYVDGVLEMDSEFSLASLTLSASTDIAIGNYAGDFHFNGQIDDVRFWNTSRTVVQIAADMNSCITGSQPNLVAAYNFNEGTGTELMDLSGNGHNSTLIGMDGTAVWVDGVSNCLATTYQLSTTPTVTIGIMDQTASILPTTVCAGGSATVSIASSELGVNYYLRDNTDNSVIEGPIAGDGNPIDFTAETISDRKTYNVYCINPSTGLYFDGTDDYVGITTHTDFNFDDGDFAIEAWIKTDITLGAGVEQAIISNTYLEITAFKLGRSGNKVVFNVAGASSQIVSDTEINDDIWHHIVGVRTAGKIELYVDGVLEIDSDYSLLSLNASTDIAIGNIFAGDFYFNGQIDDVRFWNTSRTAAEIATDMNSCIIGAQPGLVAAYNFEEGTGSEAMDLSGKGHHSTLNNMDNTAAWVDVVNNCSATSYQLSTTPTVTMCVMDQTPSVLPTTVCAGGSATVSIDSSEIGVNYYLRDDTDDSVIEGPVPGDGNPIDFTAETISADKTYNVYGIRLSTGLYFNGTDDYVWMNGHSDFEFGIGDFAIEAWIKTDITLAAGVEQGIISNTSFNVGGIIKTVFWLGRSGNKVVFNIAGTDSQTFSDTEINDDKWHHIVGVRTLGKIELYVDGVLEGDTEFSLTPLNPSTAISNSISIGNFHHDFYFNGQIDDVRFWNTSRTAAQIAADMNSCITGAQPGLVASYNFEEGTGTTLMDLSGNGHNSALINMDGTAAWVDGVENCSTIFRKMSTKPTVTVGVDTDSDGISDACDACPNDADNDADDDGACGDVDLCEGFDDILDSDGDGTPDGCDIEECDNKDNNGNGEIDEGFTHSDLNITAVGNLLTADEPEVDYRWLNCDDNNSPISLATDRAYTAIANGNYAVEITNESCIDTTECITVTTTRIDLISSNGVSIYPNPNKGLVNIDLGTLTNVSITIRAADGRLIYQEAKVSDGIHQVQIDAENGVYFIQLQTEDAQQHFQIVKE
ncbi:MAG: T9SS type A sorting domain-containing protein [Flavobacteriales bacterium]|nr:T9SS type A sorting domain-containing protein [Flavobacteriales bacterium]